MKKDHWENQEEVAEFVKRQIERLGFPQFYEMENMTDPHISDTVIGAAARGQLDPKRAKERTLAGLRSLAKATGAPAKKTRCPTCGNYYYEVQKQ